SSKPTAASAVLAGAVGRSLHVTPASVLFLRPLNGEYISHVLIGSIARVDPGMFRPFHVAPLSKLLKKCPPPDHCNARTSGMSVDVVSPAMEILPVGSTPRLVASSYPVP